MTVIATAIDCHIAAGSLWTLLSLVIAVTSRGPRPLLAVQMGAAFVALVAGIILWNALHAGPFGPAEHRLVVGTVSAFVALGLQVGIVAPALLGAPDIRLAAGGRVLWRTSSFLLVLAGMAMAGSRYV